MNTRRCRRIAPRSHSVLSPLTGVALLIVALPAAAQDPKPTPTPTPPVTATDPQKPTPPDQKSEEEPTETVIRLRYERSNSLVGIANSATQGTVGPMQLGRRPIFRAGEVLETVPGLIATQHSGDGKANQYFLRGFNLDHGTDFATWVAGMPVNQTTHGHGQGYTDINFVIPELVSQIAYRKGSYFAGQGDFSSAGTAEITYADRIAPIAATLEGGAFGFGRFLIAGTPEGLSPRSGDLLYGLELTGYNGPWDIASNFRKVNGVLRWSRTSALGTEGQGAQRYAVTLMGYDGKWTSTDQVANRAVSEGLIGRFGSLDPSDGGKSYRYSLSGEVERNTTRGVTAASVYAIAYKLNLWSNFTYFLDHPETNPAGQRGDQFEQADDRRTYGLTASHTIKGNLSRARPTEAVLGLQVRHDDIKNVGLYNTEKRVRFNTTREDSVNITSIAPYAEYRVKWAPQWRTVIGARYDQYRFDVDSNIAQNSGSRSSGILSPKATLAYTVRPDTELYVNAGQGFHSNDARGTVIRVDPNTGEPARRVTPLVRTDQAELGVRTTVVKGLQSTFSLWYLDLDSELLFIGDAGTTEASRPSRRTGIEFTNYYAPNRYLSADLDIALSRARFTDRDPAGTRIPGAVETVIALGVAAEHPRGYFGALRLRHFGPRPLLEDNSIRSKSTTLINARLGYKARKDLDVSLEMFNLFNSRSSDIDYYYDSRLAGEPEGGFADIHTHPTEPFALRLNLRFRR